MFLKVGRQLLLRVAEHGGVFVKLRDVAYVAQRREHRELRELAHAGHEQELDVPRAVLHLRIDSREPGAHGFGLGNIVKAVAHGSVVLVDEDRDALAAIGSGKRFDGVAEVHVRRLGRVVCVACISQPVLDMVGKVLRKLFLAGRREVVELEVYDGVFLPRPFQRVDGKPLEKLAPSLEERLERGDCQRLPESARPRDEEELCPNSRD